MNTVPQTVYTAYFLSVGFWLLLTLSFLLLGRKNKKAGIFRNKMLNNWKQSLAIALLYYVFIIIGSWDLSYATNFLSPLQIFCQCLFGFALAESISGNEPLAVTKAVMGNDKKYRRLVQMIAFGLLIAIVSFIIGQVSQSICMQLFNEKIDSNAVNTLHQSKGLLFFTLFSGAGIGEETLYRLILISLFIRLTKKRSAAIVLSSLIFGLYHLSPLNQMYLTYWHYPVSQFVSTCLVGLVFGYFYLKRGYETVVIGHTLADWLPIMIFMK